MLPGYNHDDPAAVVNGGVMLPGYDHDDPAAVVDGCVYVGRYRLSHREVSLMEAQPEAELTLQVLQHFRLHKRPVMVAAK